MKQIEKISENNNYTAANIGNLSKLMDYSMIHPKNKKEVFGKVFLKDATGATGTEISFQELPPQTDLSYFHIHNENEETYIVLKGSGDFQVDEDCFPITEGSVIRVAPQGKRSLRNSSDEPMVYMVIQSKKDSLNQYSSEDGERVEYKAKWDK
ncbi:MAG: cupin domain-containing protein [Prevotella sp.]|jgi:mannose-6-phosphate isomerase-like protein (cupin superfamily)|nr:cupin domain-containing protein [Prevotella sp.]